jgi:hypothetical protein
MQARKKFFLIYVYLICLLPHLPPHINVLQLCVLIIEKENNGFVPLSLPSLSHTEQPDCKAFAKAIDKVS